MLPLPKPSLPPSAAVSSVETGLLKNIKRLIWLYFFLLIFEGTLRKWVLPQFSDVLLVIRDPVALAIYYLALRARIFPRSGYIFVLAIMGVLFWAVALLVLSPYLAPKPLILVTGFGFRSNFLHLPLIFVMAKALTPEDVKRLGWWVVLGMIPMALLLAAQFNAAPDSFINRTAGLGEAQQITAGGGKIRPPGTFSFVSGVIFYCSLSAAYLLYAALTKGVYRNWLVYSSGFALVIAIGVSGSRSVFLAVLMVISSMLVILLLRPTAINQFGRSLLIATIALVVASRLPVFKEGVEILSDRFTETAEAEESTIAGGLLSRMASGFTEGFLLAPRAPLWGYGLGIGTNAGAKFLTGRTIFLLTEGEWGRIVLESGPILGMAYLLWRTILTAHLGFISCQRVREGETLPLILFCAGFLALLTGQFGQPTNLGFAVFVCGLCLAAAGPKAVPIEPGSTLPVVPAPRIARRSSYAERLHGSDVNRPQANGSLDR